MDVITIIWYFSTFVALVAFFIVMACSETTCGRGRKPEVIPERAPPTPAPSYREFAPPSYDTVMEKYKNRVFIIPVHEQNKILGINAQNFVSPSGGIDSGLASSSSMASTSNLLRQQSIVSTSPSG